MPMIATSTVTMMPTESEVPVPCTMRENTSQPCLVKPSGCPGSGPWFEMRVPTGTPNSSACAWVCTLRMQLSFGGTEVNTPGKIATNTMKRMITAEIQNIQRLRRSRHASSQRFDLRSLTRTASTAPSPPSSTSATKRGALRTGFLLDIADPRVEHSVEEVDGDVHEHVDDHEDRHDRDDLGGVVSVDGFEQLVADTWHVEDALGDRRADDQDAEVGGDVRGDGDHRVAQDVHGDHAPSREALAVRHAHEVVLAGLDHRRAREAQHVGEVEAREHDGRE